MQTGWSVMWQVGRGGQIMQCKRDVANSGKLLGRTAWHVLENSSVRVGAPPGCPIRVTVLRGDLLKLTFWSMCKGKSSSVAEFLQVALLGPAAGPAPKPLAWTQRPRHRQSICS